MQSLAVSEAYPHAQSMDMRCCPVHLLSQIARMPQTAARSNPAPEDVSAEYDQIIYNEMRREEMNVPPLLAKQIEVTAVDRGLLMDWLDRLHYKCQLTTATYYRCAGIMDRIFASVTLRKQDLLVIGAAAMHVASKVEDHRPMSSEQAVIIGEGAFTREDLLAAESKIMQLLDFRVTFPTILFFLTHYLRILDDTSICTVLYCRYAAEVATTSADFFGVLPSAIACSVLVLMRLLKNTEPWPSEMAEYTDYSLEDLKPHVVQLQRLLSDRDRKESTFMRRKYASDLFHAVALYPVPELPSEFYS